MTIGRSVHRFRMKGVIAPIGVTATVLASLAVGLPSAQATGGTDQRGTDALFGTWAWSRFTDAQADPNPPADPDGQGGEDNLANIIQIGERFQKQAPGTESTQLSGWVVEAPEGEGWVRLPGADGEKRVQDEAAFDETVVDKKAWTETVMDEEAHWQRYSWTGGSHEGNEPPTFPSDDWQPNTKSDPHDRGVEGAYFRSHGGNGNGDWFYLQAVAAKTHTVEHPEMTHVVHHPAVTHQEFSYQRPVTTPGHIEYYWSVYQRTNTPDQPDVTDPTDPTVPSDPSVPTVNGETPVQPVKVEAPVPTDPTVPSVKGDVSVLPVKLKASGPKQSTQRNVARSHADAHRRALPLSIDAGL